MARGRVANLFVKVGVNTRAFKRDMGKMNRIFGQSMARMGRVGSLASLGAGAAFTGMAVAAIRASTEMNEGMANVATLIPGNIERVKDLKKAIQDMAVATGKATKDLTGGLYQVISAFQDTTDTVKILEINTKAAVAGLSSVTDAVNLTSAVTKGYGNVSAEAVQHISDLAFETVRLGQTTFPQLAQSMGRVVPTAAALGAEIEELFGLYSTLTGVTGDAALVTTQLRGVLGAFLKPSAAMKDAIAGLNYENAQHIISSRGIVGALQDVITTTDGTAESIGKLFQNRRALPAVFILAGGQAETFTRKLEAMNNAMGATERAYLEQTEGINKLGHEWKIFSQKSKVFMQELGDSLGYVILRTVKAVEWLGKFRQAAMFGMTVKQFDDLRQSAKEGADAISAQEAAVQALRVEYEKLTGTKFIIPEIDMPDLTMVAGIKGAGATDVELLTEAIRKYKLEQANAAIEAERMAKAVEWAALQAKLIKIPAIKFDESVEAERYFDLLERMQGISVPTTVLEQGTEAILAWVEAHTKARSVAQGLDNDIGKLKYGFEQIPPRILVGEHAIQDWKAEAMLAADVAGDFAAALFDAATAGEDAFERLTEAVKRFVEDAIANFVRLKVLNYLIPDWLKPYLSGGNITVNATPQTDAGAASLFVGPPVPPQQLQSNFVPPEYETEPPPLLTIPGPTFDIEPPPVLSIAPVYDITIPPDIAITPIFDVAIPPAIMIPSPAFEVAPSPALRIAAPVFDVEIPKALMIPAPVYEYEIPAPVELMIPAPIVSYAMPPVAEIYEAAPSPVAEPMQAYNGQPVNITVHDNRSADAPPVDIKERTNPLGGREIEFFIHDTVNKGLSAGKYDRNMSGIYRVSRQGRRR